MTLVRTLTGAAVAAVLAVSTPVAARDLSIALGAEPSSMDPHYHNLTPNNALNSHVFDSLIHQDERQRLVPGLATSWRTLDETTWEVELRQGVTWHDGQPFTSDDVLFTFERAPAVEGSPSSFALYTGGKSLEKIDDHTIRITTEGPAPLLPNDLSNIFIVSKRHGEGARTEDYNSGKAAIGTGPYRFVSYVPGDRAVFERNDDYWGEKPEWTRVTVRTISSDPTRVAALLAGDVDLIEAVPTTDIEGLKNDARVELSQGISNRVIYLHMDHFREDSPFIRGKDGSAIENPLLDRRVRLAISKAINRPAIVSRVMEGVAIPAGQLLPEGFFGVSPNLEPMAFDADGARALLAEAGYGDGFRMTLHGPAGRYLNDARILEAVAQMLSRIGIEASVETMPPSVFFNRASRGADGEPEFSFILVGWGAGTGEASSPLRSLIHTFNPEIGGGASNRGRYSNPEIDALIQEALVTVDDTRRAELLAQATELAMEDLAIIALHYQVNTWGGRKGIKYRARTDEYTRAMDAFTE